MNLNGQTLKICFLMIVGTLCTLLIVLTAGAAFHKVDMPVYVELIGGLGITGLFGAIIQAFIHANQVQNPQEDSHEKVMPIVRAVIDPNDSKSSQS